jgi:hypothetical protein
LKAIKQPESLEDEQLRRLAKKAILTDFIYSPLAIKHQFARGKLGENIIRSWIEANKIEFKDEKEMKKDSIKTPDFYFTNPIEIKGKEIRWIESKALFGDAKTHWIYSKKQYSKYLELFGEGYVVYWFGCLSDLDGGILDETFFKTTMKNALLDMRIYMTDYMTNLNDKNLNEKILKLVRNLGISCLVNFSNLNIELNTNVEMRSFRQDNALKMAEKIVECYANGRILALFDDVKAKIVKNIKFVLKNMGFDVVII